MTDTQTLGSGKDRVLRTCEVAEMFDVSERTITCWISSGKLEAFKTLGGHYRVMQSVVIKKLEELHISEQHR